MLKQIRTIGPRRSDAKDYPREPDILEQSLDSNSSWAKTLEHVGENKTVLDFGCATGELAKFLTLRGCSVDGIEKNPAAANEARAVCNEVIVADLDTTALSEILGQSKFDVGVFGDVLEHLRNPWRILDEMRAHLNDGGFIVASIPNIAHGAIRLSILNGAFDYRGSGLLDDTHLRFFTGKSVDEMLVRAGYRILAMDRTRLPIFERSDLLPSVAREDFSPEVVARIECDPEAETLQFIVKAVPLDDEDKQQAVTHRFLLANGELASARGRISELQAMQRSAAHEELERANAAIEELKSRLHIETYRANELEVQLKSVESESSTIQDLLKAAPTREDLEQATALIEELKSRLHVETNRANGLEVQLKSSESDNATKIPALEAELAHARSRFSDLLTLLRGVRAEADAAAAQLERTNATLSERDARIAELEASYAIIGTDVERLGRELSDAHQRALDQVNLVEAAAAHLERTNAMISERDARVAELEAANKDIGAEIERLGRELSTEQQRALDQADLLQAAEARTKVVAAELDIARHDGQEALRVHDQLEATEAEYGALRDERRNLCDMLAKGEQEFHETNRRLEALSAESAARDSRINSYAAEIAKLKDDLDNASDKVLRYSTEADVLQATVEDLGQTLSATQRERDEIDSNRNHLQVVLARTQTHLAQLDDQAGRQIKELSEALSLARELLGVTRTERDSATERVRELQPAFIELRRCLEHETAAGEQLANAYSEIERRLLAQSEAMTAELRGQIDHITVLTRMIQSGRFWTIKLRFSQLRSALSRALRMFSLQPTR